MSTFASVSLVFPTRLDVDLLRNALSVAAKYSTEWNWKYV